MFDIEKEEGNEWNFHVAVPSAIHSIRKCNVMFVTLLQAEHYHKLFIQWA
jgi:hypothetical protein